MLTEFLLTKEKLSLFEEERKRLVVENNQFKLNYETLSRSIGSPTSAENQTFSPKIPFSLENIFSNNSFGINEKSIEELHVKVQKLIEDLQTTKDRFGVK